MFQLQCEKCIDGYVRSENGYKRCECQREKITNKVFNLSSTPSKFRYYRKDLEDQKVKSSLNKNTTYLDLIDNLTSDREKTDKLINRNTTIFLKGNPGSGKTQMAVTIALEISKNFNLDEKKLDVKRFYFLDVREIGSWMFNQEKKQKIFDYVKMCDVLVIDDLGSEQYTNNYVLSNLDSLLRNFDGLKIVTTNISKEIKDFYDSKDQRLSDVLVNSKEKEHGVYNCLFYYVVKNKTRRKVSLEDLDVI